MSKKIKSLLKKIKFKKTGFKEKVQAIGGLALIFLALFIIFKYQFTAPVKNDSVSLPEVEENQYEFFSALDGLPVEKAEDSVPEVVGIMIDNHPNARPQVGLSEAKIVYEAPVEGGITRYLAIFDKKQTVLKAGPVRSARPYFIDWIKEYGVSLYMHCGGSPEALNKIVQENIFHANEMSRGNYFWRDNLKYAPHNLFTNSENWEKYFLDYSKNQSTATWQGWNFYKIFSAFQKEVEIVSLSSTTSIKTKSVKIKYGSDYVVEWKYNEENKNYERYLNGVAQKDGDKIISADNILIQSVNIKITDEVGRRQIDTVGRGEARVLRLGFLDYGFWRKNNEERTRFYNEAEEEFLLVPGKIWVEVISKNTVIEVGN